MLTPGSDTYGSLDDLQAILLDLGHGSYVDATDTLTMEGHARQARVGLHLAFDWLGVRAVPGQALAWPRSGAIDQDRLPIPS